MIRHRRTAPVAAALTLGVALTAVLGFAAPASAHVSVDPQEATQGGYGRFAFRVPNESDSATTTRIEVVLPDNAPLGSVTTMPVPGWTVTVQKRKVDPPVEVHGSSLGEVVSRLIWTASGDAAVRPGQFQEFPVTMGPLPQVDRMVFKTLQTYSDGSVVRWIEEPVAAGGTEPASPAPVLILTAAASASASAAPVAAEADGGDGGDGGAGTLLGTFGLVAGLAGFVLGGAAFARTRRQPTTGS